MDYSYIVCDLCGHVETRSELADPPSKCENCKHAALWSFADQDEAELHSQHIVDKAMAS